MVIDLKNRENLKSSIRNNIPVNSGGSIEVSKLNHIDKSKDEKRSSSGRVLNIFRNNKYAPDHEHISIILNLIFLSTLSFIVFLDWGSIWQLPKSIVLVIGTMVFLVLFSILWIFGKIKNKVYINLGDIIIVFFGIIICLISFFNPNKISFWGTTTRIFDSGVFIFYLILLYLILKLFLDYRVIKTYLIFLSILSILGGTLSIIVLYLNNFIPGLKFLDKLSPSFSALTEYPQELVFLTILSQCIFFIYCIKLKSNKDINNIVKFLYYISIIVNILLVIRMPNYSMYIILVITLIINWLISIQKFKTNNLDINNVRLMPSRITFIYGVIIILVTSLIFIRTFKNNSSLGEFSDIYSPNFTVSFDIWRQSIQSDTWFGSSSIMYAWNRFASEYDISQAINFSFDTLYSEAFNIAVKNGIIGAIFISIMFIWIMGVLLRFALIYKFQILDTYPVFILTIGFFILPFTVITKVFAILILLVWTSSVAKYFKPNLILNLNINQISSTISSLFTFVILFVITISFFTTNKVFNILKSQDYIIDASKEQDNYKKLKLMNQAIEKSPYMIEYANLYAITLIQGINSQALALSSQNYAENTNITLEQQQNIRNDILRVEELIDKYKKNFNLDSTPLLWELDLYSISDKYGYIDEYIYFAAIEKGQDLHPHYLYWDLYKSQYYVRKSQKKSELDQVSLQEAKRIFDSILQKNQGFVEAYQAYYDLLGIEKKYKEQINLLNIYVNFIEFKNSTVDKRLAYYLGVAYQNNKQYTEAISVYNKLLETFPDYTNVYFKLGEIYEIEKNTDLAIQNYQKVLELDPNAEPARLKLEQLR